MQANTGVVYDEEVIKLLPIILVVILIAGGLGYWRFASKPSLTTPTSTNETSTPVEVPKSLPQTASLEERVEVLEEALVEAIKRINNLSGSTTAEGTDLGTTDASIIELKARVSALEKATPAPAASSKSTVYIPLGSGGGPWSNTDWSNLDDYQITLDPSNFPGYSGMVLEVNFRMVESAGTASVRLYNKTDSSATSSEISTTSTSFGTNTSSSFKLPSGSKNYTLQLKSTQNKDIFIQTARIRVSF